MRRTGKKSQDWVDFIARGENPMGMVAELPNNTTVNAGWFNNNANTPPNSPEFTGSVEPGYIRVEAYKRRRA